MFSFIWKLWWRPAYLVPMLGASGLWVNIHLLWHGALIFVVLTERPPMFRGLLRQIMRWEPFVSRILRRRPNLKAIFFLLISKDLRSCFIQMFCVLMFSMSVPFLEMLEKMKINWKYLAVSWTTLVHCCFLKYICCFKLKRSKTYILCPLNPK